MNTGWCCGCGKTVPGGLKILGGLLCADCEHKIVTMDIRQWDYEQWLGVFRKLWEGVIDSFKEE